MIYFDNSATTPVCKTAADEMMQILTDNFGNPSSRHEAGLRAFQALKLARSRVAKAIGCVPDELYFTPSGTVANNTALFGAAKMMRHFGNRIITTSLEHPSVSEPLKALEQNGFEVIRLPADRSGKLSLSALRGALNAKTILLSMMLVNNEIGVINPIAEASKIVRSVCPRAIIHCDAVQGFGKIKVSPSLLGVDLLTVSAHKIHGPKGAGALYIKQGLHLPPYILGGGQENGMISGTEAMPAIVGFGAAAAALPADLRTTYENVQFLRNRLVKKVSQTSFVAVNSPADAIPYVLNLSVPGVPSEVMINALSDQGICVSAGSACKKGHRSEVLKAIGMDTKRIDSAIRISFSRFTTENEIDRFADVFLACASRFLR